LVFRGLFIDSEGILPQARGDSNAMTSFREKILNLLEQGNVLTSAQKEELLELHKKGNARFSHLLVKDFVRADVLNESIKTGFALEPFTISLSQVDLGLLSVVSKEILTGYLFLPISRKEDQLTLAIADPLVLLDLEDIAEFQEYVIKPVLVSRQELEALFKGVNISGKVEGKPEKMEDILSDVSGLSGKPLQHIDFAEIVHIAQESPIVKATSFILDKAIELKASDILIEPLEECTRVRCRLDGVWHQIERLPKKFHSFIITRIKVLSELDIAEHRFPQDGTFKIKLKDRAIDFRVSIFPCSNGEKAVIRVLDKSLGLLDIDRLGLKAEELAKLKSAARLPHGIILVCGPAGSGKTTTLYSILKFVNTPEKNIITVEDPVEYAIKGINQVSINLKAGVDFSRCLRSILRQDPNIIMIGEIRDSETADIAFKAALTGHLVLSTLHTTTAPGAVIRLRDMGVEPFLINASLIGVMSQRLARRVCVHCRQSDPSHHYFSAKGCHECLETGYSGRLLIGELLYMNAQIREQVLSKQVEEKKIKDLARASGMRTFREEGMDFARAGLTTLEEVLRVTPPDE
jgi:type IV pilus assembly protein PilB